MDTFALIECLAGLGAGCIIAAGIFVAVRRHKPAIVAYGVGAALLWTAGLVWLLWRTTDGI